MRTLTLLVAASALAMGALSAMAADAPVAKSTAATTAPKYMAQGGRFHTQHVKKLKFSCDSCHQAGVQDVLFLRAAEPLPAGMPGQVDRAICLTCHQAPQKPTFYGPAK